PEALSALENSDTVTVETGKWLVFTPLRDGVATTGYIFYPGGRVDYRSYAPMAQSLAEEGFLVIIPRMPLNLAVFGINEAADVMATYPEIKHWVLGGHSLGGSMAASYVFEHPGQIDGLVFLASYPADNNNLSNYTGKVLSISASLDGLATPEKITHSVELLPDSTEWVVIEGGNHAQFGWYGAQKGDNAPTISREDQQKEVIQGTLNLLTNTDQ
ncbi:alpha/beta hydrolase, partial [bacterium]|nr:alpha/beta hydrolase [bacterium]